MKTYHYLSLFFYCLSGLLAAQSPLFLDETFQNNGAVIHSSSKGNTQIFAVETVEEKVVFAGYSYNNGQEGLLLGCLNDNGELDTDFGDNGFVEFYETDAITVKKLLVQPYGNDYRLLVFYSTQNSLNEIQYFIGAFDSDGNQDYTYANFSEWRIELINPLMKKVTDVAVDTDGNLYATGLNPNNYPNHILVQQYTNQGILDFGFGPGGFTSYQVLTLTESILDDPVLTISDNKIIAASILTGFNDIVLAQFLLTGVLDTDFGNNTSGGALTIPSSDGEPGNIQLTSDPDGSIFASYFKSDFSFLLRISSTGEVEQSVQTDIPLNISKLIANDEGLFASTQEVFYEYSTSLNFIDQMEVDLDSDFEMINDFAVSANQAVVIGGSTLISLNDLFKGYVQRFENGAVDCSFGNSDSICASLFSTGNGVESYRSTLATTDQIYAVGAAEGNLVLSLFDSNGDLNTEFGEQGFNYTPIDGGTAYVMNLKKQGDKVLLAGTRRARTGLFGGNYDFLLARFLANGELDPSFGTNGIRTDNFGACGIGDIDFQSDGKIIAFGSSTDGPTNNTNALNYSIARYLEDGTLDLTFGDNNNGLFTFDPFQDEDWGYTGVVMPNDFITLVGYSKREGQPFNPNHDIVLLQLTPEGSLNTNFLNNGWEAYDFGEDEYVHKAVMHNNKIIVVGNTRNGANRDFLIARFNANGTLDNNFGTGGIIQADFNNGDDRAYDIKVEDDYYIISGQAGLDMGLIILDINGELITCEQIPTKIKQGISANKDVVISTSILPVETPEGLLYSLFSAGSSNEDFALAKFIFNPNCLTVNVETIAVNTDIDFTISPNPSSQFINVNYRLNQMSNVQIGLFDLNGKQVNTLYEGIQTTGQHQIRKAIDVPAGTYVCRLQIDEAVFAQTIIRVD